MGPCIQSEEAYVVILLLCPFCLFCGFTLVFFYDHYHNHVLVCIRFIDGIFSMGGVPQSS
jgi:hypothetical protein